MTGTCNGCAARPAITRHGFCIGCVETAANNADYAAVGLPERIDVYAAMALLLAHDCDTVWEDGEADCPVCAAGTNTCPECDRPTDEMGYSDRGDHLLYDDWVAVGCEGGIMPILRIVVSENTADRKAPR